MNIVLRQGLIVGPTSSVIGDVLIVDGSIAEVGTTVDAPSDAHEIDARDCWIGPGFVDLHTHLREPGREAAETIDSGARAAPRRLLRARGDAQHRALSRQRRDRVLRARARRHDAARYLRGRRHHPGSTRRGAGADGGDGGPGCATLHGRRHRGAGSLR
jgi:predicted amidohydrolase YtcJ